MPNRGWGGDLDAAKEFHSKVHRPLGDDRRGRGGARGGARVGRGGFNLARGGNSSANISPFVNVVGKRRHDGLLTKTPSHLLESVNESRTQNTQAASAEDRGGDPMNIDNRGLAGSQWASATRTGTGSVPTPASWGTIPQTTQSTQPAQPAQAAQAASGLTPAPSGFTDSSRIASHARAPSSPVHMKGPEPIPAINPARPLGVFAHTAFNDDTNGSRVDDVAESQPATREQVTWGPRNAPLSVTHLSKSPSHRPVTDEQMKDTQNSNNASESSIGAGGCKASATETSHQWSGLKASRHAGAASPARPTAHMQRVNLRLDLLQENGMLRGVQFTEDQGPQQDDDWLKTYNLNKVKDKCVLVAEQATAAGDYEAEKALRKVASACNEVLHAKNEIKDKKVEGEADKVLSQTQNAAWVHWIKFYHPTAPAADPACARAPNESSNVKRQDAPVIFPSQNVQVQVPHAPIETKLQPQASPAATQRPRSGGADTKGFDCVPSSGLGSSTSQQLHKPAAQAQVLRQQPKLSTQSGGRTPAGGLGSAKTEQTQATAQQPQTQGTQQPTELTGLPSMFPQGLPAGFDNPQARKIFEDFFFQNKRLSRN